MLQLPALFFSSFLIALSGAMMPGPLLTATIGESVKRGAKAGPLIMSGHALLEGALVIALMFGLAPLLKKDPFFIGVSFAGAAILAWMSAGMLRSVPSLKIDWDADAGEGGGGSIIAAGALLSIANPYWVVWWATIGLTFLSRSQEVGFLGILFFFLGHQAADFAWYSIVSTAVGKGRRFFSDRIYRGVIAVSALVLIGFALYFSWSGLERLVS
ncbi:MAG: LysE family transporter [Sediminispirochaetaceae bacterium]